jgi:hypothetical protein
MTAKEEAKELVQLFYNNQCSHSITELAYKSAKQCALICVDEKIASAIRIKHPMNTDRMNRRVDRIVDELKKVKEEINKL